jgi:hypothetical protein
VPELPAGFDTGSAILALLLAITGLACGKWANQARQAATSIAGVVAGDMSIGISSWPTSRTFLPLRPSTACPPSTLDLIEALGDIEGHPWADRNATMVTLAAQRL